MLALHSKPSSLSSRSQTSDFMSQSVYLDWFGFHLPLSGHFMGSKGLKIMIHYQKGLFFYRNGHLKSTIIYKLLIIIDTRVSLLGNEFLDDIWCFHFAHSCDDTLHDEIVKYAKKSSKWQPWKQNLDCRPCLGKRSLTRLTTSLKACAILTRKETEGDLKNSLKLKKKKNNCDKGRVPKKNRKSLVLDQTFSVFFRNLFLIAENWKNANIAMLWTPESLPLNCATCWPALVRKCLKRRWKLLKSLNSIPRCFINHLPGGAADTWQGGLAGKHQLWGVCQDGSRPIGGDGGGGRDGERPWPGSRTFSLSLSFKFYLFNPFVFY